MAGEHNPSHPAPLAIQVGPLAAQSAGVGWPYEYLHSAGSVPREDCDLGEKVRRKWEASPTDSCSMNSSFSTFSSAIPLAMQSSNHF